MDVEGLFDEGAAAEPQPEKQIPASPPEYEEPFDDDPPEYTEEDLASIESQKLNPEVNEHLDDLGVRPYSKIDEALSSSSLSKKQKQSLIKESLKTTTFRQNQLKGHKSSFTKKFKKGEISEEGLKKAHEGIDQDFKVLRDYKKYYMQKLKTFQHSGSGIRRKRGGNITFFNNPKELLKKLEVIIGELNAGNTNINMRNTGVAILDVLLKSALINKSQHEKLFRNYFKT